MPTLRELRVNLGWSQTELGIRAGVSAVIVKRAEEGVHVRARTAKALADALSKGYEREIKPADIAELQIL